MSLFCTFPQVSCVPDASERFGLHSSPLRISPCLQACGTERSPTTFFNYCTSAGARFICTCTFRCCFALRSEYNLQEVRYSIIELRDLLPLFATFVPLSYSHSHKCLETTLQGFSLRGFSQGVAREASSSS